MENVYKPKVSKRQIRSFSNTEVNMILKHFDRNTFVGFRNYAIMITLFATGIRISELCGLQAVDIMFELNVINIIGKGDKQRKVPMSENLRKILLKYFKMRNEYIDENVKLLILHNHNTNFIGSGVKNVRAYHHKNDHPLC